MVAFRAVSVLRTVDNTAMTLGWAAIKLHVLACTFVQWCPNTTSHTPVDLWLTQEANALWGSIRVVSDTELEA